jgi:hypothetical protein
MEAQQWQQRSDEIDELCKRIGVNEEGWMPAEDFEATYRRYKKVEKHWVSRGHSAADWPFSSPVGVEQRKEEGVLTRALRRLLSS